MIGELAIQMISRRASDIHLHVGSPPIARIDGHLSRFGDKILTPDDMRSIVKELMTERQLAEFEHRYELDFGYSFPSVGRFRCNVFKQRGSVGIVMRVIHNNIPSFESLGLPTTLLEDYVNQDRGLILVTGPTGSGKSTTLASMVDYINRHFAYNIITIEDPIEFLHKNHQSIVVQREVGQDTSDFKSALKYALRQDPDVILIGEMRDKETVEAALSAAQTGHLVLSTLHTQDAMRTVNRIIDFFAPHEREQIRIQLSDSLIGIVSQRLLRKATGEGRVLAYEALINTPLIREYIRDEEKTPLIKDALAEGSLRGMHTFDQYLVRLYEEQLITLDEAIASATSAHELRLMLTSSNSW
ncbi:type IV pilus twitching motility protein PilT [Deinococcus misasensis]|uniref:type IV pilus twitching motility protein PilT n=1 Tax=Deinococcus misasensis TaxID=392413 RepID=UPI00054D65B7|nr:PilT/PilU family type 4a pilus ATPase [Deinococcus misasensis]